MTFSGQNEMESAETRLHLETKSRIVLRKTSLKYQPTEHQKYYRRSAEQLKYYRRNWKIDDIKGILWSA